MSDAPHAELAPDPAPPPACPRCGYDLSGQVATWAHACPLAGTCSECGLDLRWGSVFAQKSQGPRWLIEHRHAVPTTWWRAILRTSLQGWATALRLTSPSRFWAAVPMTVPVARNRLTLFVVVTFGTLQVIIAAGEFMRAIAYVSNDYLQPLPVTSWFNRPLSPWLAIDPRGDRLIYPPSSTWFVHTFGLATWFDRASGPDRAVLLGVLLAPVLLLLLAQTRRTVDVRNRHIIRAATYGLLPVTALLCLEAARHLEFLIRIPWNLGGPQPPDPWMHTLTSDGLRLLRPMIYSILAAWFARYWWCVIAHSLMLPRPHLIWWLLMLQTVLVTGVCLVFDSGSVLWLANLLGL